MTSFSDYKGKRTEGSSEVIPGPVEPCGGVREPLAVDLCCGLGGWTEGLLQEGYQVRGYDIEAHEYGDEKYPAELVIKSILDMHGSEVADADLIVASPPCQEFSYMAMPWGRAKQISRALRGEGDFPEAYRGSRTLAELTALFDACFRIQREASEAAGRHIPMVLENVKGAQPWVGRAPWSFGSYFLWGDIPALMPIQRYHERLKVKAGEQWNVNRENFTGTRGWDEGLKNPGFRFDGGGGSFQTAAVKDSIKNAGGSWFNIGSPGQKQTNCNPVHRLAAEGIKCGGDWFGDDNPSALRHHSSKSPQRKRASAQIAKIPLALSTHIARVYKPRLVERAAA